MKKLLIVAAISAVSLTSFAQEEVKSYNLISVSNDITLISANKDQRPFGLDASSSEILNGFGFEYTHGFGLGSNTFFEAGLKFNTGFYNESQEGVLEIDEIEFDYKETLEYAYSRVSVPLSLSHRFHHSGKFYITPYAGIDLHLNLTGTTKDTVELDDEKVSVIYNWFKKEETNPKFKRFQMGWHIGVRAEYYRGFVNANFGTDFLPVWKKDKFKFNTLHFAIGIGYRF